MNHSRLGLIALAVAVLCLGALAVASSRHLTAPLDDAAVAAPRPEVANPVSSPPSPEFLELKARAIRQPSGELTEDAVPARPPVAMPQR